MIGIDRADQVEVGAGRGGEQVIAEGDCENDPQNDEEFIACAHLRPPGFAAPVFVMELVFVFAVFVVAVIVLAARGRNRAEVMKSNTASRRSARRAGDMGSTPAITFMIGAMVK